MIIAYLLWYYYYINIFIFNFSEYDSEMDDFIDDSDAKIDISAEIRNIFGYDRRKFRDEVRVLKTLTESTASMVFTFLMLTNQVLLIF